MNTLEQKMIEALIDLKENHHVLGIKAEFEAEGTRMEEALRLKDVVSHAGLELTIKVGGCEAIKDMFDARTIGINAMVVPMIESPYALKKAVHAINFVFPEEERKQMKFLINIETIYGFKYIDEMLQTSEINDLSGFVFGRTDMTGSLGMSKDDINHPDILEYAKQLATKTKEHNKELVIGGGVSAMSLPFFKALPQGALTRFETRKVIFDAPAALADKNADKGILKAVAFELLWIKNKKDYYGNISKEDNSRIHILETRYKDSIIKAGGIIED